MKKLKTTRAVTYRRYGIPALILEGKWLTEKYRLAIGDLVDIDYQPKEIRFKKNVLLSKERQKRLKEREELRKQRINELSDLSHDNQARNQEASEGQSAEHSG